MIIRLFISAAALALLLLACTTSKGEEEGRAPGTGTAATSDGSWESDAPGVERRLELSEIPPPVEGMDPEGSIARTANVVPPPQGALPKVPDGFVVNVFATGLQQPRRVRIAPNGDVFVSESGAGRVVVFRAGARGAAAPEVFASNLNQPYGIAFHPPQDPRHVYVAAANQVVRYPYDSGAAKAAGPAEVIVDNIPTERHWTRDLAVSQDGSRLFVAIGSASNLGVGGMPDMTAEQIQRHERTHGRGAAWGQEENRAVVRVFDPMGKSVRNFATGLRNCSGLVMQPDTDNLWCVVNERDHLGPDSAPDFMTRVHENAFYGWPWYYLDGREDPALKGKRPDLKGEVRTPDVLIQAHSSALSAAFYDADAFPDDYQGDAFVALHGSHSRPEMTGYKVIRVDMDGDRAAGRYEDFMTGFVIDNETVWGRPAGLAITRDGALLVTDDGNGIIYRVTNGGSR